MFQGADVDGLDTLARRTNEAADFADDVVVALRIVVAALKAMSWTGWAAAFAAYLEGVVIPWVQATGRYLRAFASLLALTSAEQKEVSGDLPRVALPAGSWTSPTYPTQSAVIAPSISAPHLTPVAQPGGGGASGGGAWVAPPAPLGPVSTTGPGATGAGAGVTAPEVLVRADGGSSARGVTGGPVGSAGGPVGAGGGGPQLGRAGLDGVGALGAGAGVSAGDGAPAADQLARGGGVDGPSAGPATGPAAAGGGRDAPVSVTALPIGGPGGGAPDAGSPSLPRPVEGSGFSPSLAASPLGLAGIGAAAAGALRSSARRAAEDDPEAAGVPTSLHDLLPVASREEPAS